MEGYYWAGGAGEVVVIRGGLLVGEGIGRSQRGEIQQWRWCRRGPGMIGLEDPVRPDVGPDGISTGGIGREW